MKICLLSGIYVQEIAAKCVLKVLSLSPINIVTNEIYVHICPQMQMVEQAVRGNVQFIFGVQTFYIQISLKVFRWKEARAEPASKLCFWSDFEIWKSLPEVFRSDFKLTPTS